MLSRILKLSLICSTVLGNSAFSQPPSPLDLASDSTLASSVRSATPESAPATPVRSATSESAPATPVRSATPESAPATPVRSATPENPSAVPHSDLERLIQQKFEERFPEVKALVECKMREAAEAVQTVEAAQAELKRAEAVLSQMTSDAAEAMKRIRAKKAKPQATETETKQDIPEAPQATKPTPAEAKSVNPMEDTRTARADAVQALEKAQDKVKATTALAQKARDEADQAQAMAATLIARIELEMTQAVLFEENQAAVRRMQAFMHATEAALREAEAKDRARRQGGGDDDNASQASHANEEEDATQSGASENHAAEDVAQVTHPAPPNHFCTQDDSRSNVDCFPSDSPVWTFGQNDTTQGSFQ